MERDVTKPKPAKGKGKALENRDRKILEIIEAFNQSAEDFSRRNRAHCEFDTKYKGNDEIPSRITHHYAKIYFNNFYILFEYTAHGIMSLVNSILSCYVSFDKSNERLLYPMYSVMDIVNRTNFDFYIIPHITNGELMTQCFNQIAHSLEKYINEFKHLSSDPDRKNELFENLLRDMSVFFKYKITNENYEGWIIQYYPLYTNRFVLDAYTSFLTGNYKKAAKKYGKTKSKLLYEHRLLQEIYDRMSTQQSAHSCQYRQSPVPLAILDNITKFSSTSAKAKEIIVLYCSWLILGLCWAVPYGAIFFLLLSIERSSALYITGPDALGLFLPSYISGIATSYFARLKIYKFFYRKDYEKKLEIDYITNSPSIDKFMRVFVIIIIIVSIIFTVLLTKSNIKFKDNYIVDNRNFFSLKGKYYSYSQVDRVFYKASRTNDFNQVLEFPSYVIVFKDGTEIDLYDFEEAEKTEKNLIPILQEKGIKIET